MTDKLARVGVGKEDRNKSKRSRQDYKKPVAAGYKASSDESSIVVSHDFVVNVKDLAAYEEGINAELADQIERVKNGTFPKVVNAQEALLRELEKKIAIADRNRKLQIKNINELYEAEVVDLKSRFERVSSDIREQIVEELQQEAARHRAAIAAAMVPSSSAMPSAATGGEHTAPERSLRSAGPSAIVEKPDIQATISNGKTEKAINYSALLTATRKRPLNTSVSTLLDKCLGEEEMRSDFFCIVKDLESRATSYVSRLKEKEPNIILPAVNVDNNGRLIVGGTKYCVGDMISVVSSLSGESFSGVLVVITSHEIIVRSYPGPRFTFLLGHIRSGRVSMTFDTSTPETMEAVEAIKESKSRL